MRFSNPAGSSPEATSAYVQALLELLGDRDPMTVQRQTVAAVRAAVAGLPEDVRRQPEAPGKWSIHEVVQHLADSELVTAFRLRMILAHDTPPIPGYDQDRWASRLRYRDVPLENALDQLDALRRANLHLLDSLTEAEWERFGIHSERGPESVRHLTRLIAAHDLLHLRQITRIQQAVTSPSAA
jgi:hypothetical protein